MEARNRRKSDRDAAGDFCRRFGSLAVHHGFISPDQLKQAMAAQLDDDLQRREHRLLGTILHDRGWISEQQIEAVLHEIRKALS